MTKTFFDGTQSWSMADLADSDTHLRYLLETHAPDPKSYKTFCPICHTRAPCDIVSLAATGLARSAALAAAEAQNERLVAVMEKASDNELHEGGCPTIWGTREGCTCWLSSARAALASGPTATGGAGAEDEPVDQAAIDRHNAEYQEELRAVRQAQIANSVDIERWETATARTETRHESWCQAPGGECTCDAPEFGPHD